MLTAKQENFCRCVAYEGMNYTEAYRASYETECMSDKTVHEKASRMKDQDKIRARIEEMRTEICSERIMTATERQEKLSELGRSGDPYVSMRAIDLLNKMSGAYTQKVEASMDGSVHISVELSDD